MAREDHPSYGGDERPDWLSNQLPSGAKEYDGVPPDNAVLNMFTRTHPIRSFHPDQPPTVIDCYVSFDLTTVDGTKHEFMVSPDMMSMIMLKASEMFMLLTGAESETIYPDVSDDDLNNLLNGEDNG